MYWTVSEYLLLQTKGSEEISEEESTEEPERDAPTQPLHEDVSSARHPPGHEERSSQREAKGGKDEESCHQEGNQEIEL